MRLQNALVARDYRGNIKLSKVRIRAGLLTKNVMNDVKRTNITCPWHISALKIADGALDKIMKSKNRKTRRDVREKKQN